MRRFLWLILIGITYLFWRLISRKPKDPNMGWRNFSRVHKKKQRFQTGAPMVKDPQCGVYIPRDEAIQRDGNYFCSEECAQKWSQKSATS